MTEWLWLVYTLITWPIAAIIWLAEIFVFVV